MIVDEDFDPIYYGFGACHDLRDSDEPALPLARCKSVSRAAARILAPKAKERPRNPVGFYTGRSR